MQPTHRPETTEETRLESWKEIANYLQRNIVTVRRWEKKEGLPVHRHSHNSRASVYAYSSEIDSWRETRKLVPDPPTPVPLWRRLLTPSFAAAILLCLITVGSPRFMEAGQGQTKTLVCSGDDCVGAISPDGKSLLVRTNDSVVIRDIASKKDRTLVVASSGFRIGAPLWSPDGSRIAYSRLPAGPVTPATRAQQEVVVVNRDGTKSHIVTSGGAFPYAWSPDSKRLLIETPGADKTTNLQWVTESTGAIQKLSITREYYDAAKVSPDGKYIAFTTAGPTPDKAGGTQDNLYVMASDGSGATIVSPSAEYQEPVDWTPDGRLVFEQDGASTSLWVVSLSSGKPQGPAVSAHVDLPLEANILGLDRSGALYYRMRSQTQPSLEIARFDFAAGRAISPPATAGPAVQTRVIAQYDWSPDGKYLAYMTPDSGLGGGGPAIVIRSAETDVVRIIQGDGVQPNAQPRWAPDSRTLLVPARGGIRLVDSQTDKISRFKANGALEKSALYAPAWSPDQKKIYFAAGIEDQTAFFESDPDLKNLREIVRRPDIGGLNLTPDGHTIITPFGPNGVPLMAVPVVGGEPKNLHNRPYSGNVYISPNGKYIGLAAASPTPMSDSAWVIPIGGGELRKLLTAEPPMVVSMVMWAPDSNSLFLRKSTTDGKQPEIWRAPLDGGEAVKVDTGLDVDRVTRAFRVSPAGNQIAYLRDPERTPPEVWVLKNFLPAAAKK